MQNSKEWQGEIRKSSSVNNAKKQRKQQNGKDISSRKLEIPKEHFMQRWAHKDRNSKDITEAEEIKWQEYTEELYKKDLNDLDNHDGVSLTWSKTSWRAEVMELQLSYFKS